jgi:hypothetical protein
MNTKSRSFRFGWWLGQFYPVGFLWLASKVGVRVAFAYERERKRRESLFGPFIATVHGEALLRAIGATEEQIARAKKEGLA